MRVHRADFDEHGSVRPGAFRNRPTDKSGMSTDWEKYSSSYDTRQRAKQPEANGVVQLQVGFVRNLPDQRVEHTPSLELNNRSHTDVFGPKTVAVRAELLRHFTLVISLSFQDET